MPSKTFFHRSLLSLAIAGIAVPSAMAQDNDSTELAPLTVYSDTYRNTATKTALEPGETPQSITVVDQTALDMRGSESVAEAMRYVPGVNTELRGGSVNRLDLFSIRGFINYQNYYDGLQLLYNDWNLQPQVDLIAVDKVEVFRGPTSSLYGSMPPGGMVNLIGKSPSTESFNRIEVTGGTQDLKQASFESTGQIGDSDLSYSLVALGRSQDNQAATTEEERYLFAPSVDWRVTDDTLVNVNLYYQKDPEMGMYSTLPASTLFGDNPNGHLDQDAFSGDANWNEFDKEVLMAGYKINHNFNDNWNFLQNFRFTDADAYQTNTYSTSLEADGRTLNREAYLTDETTTGFTVDNQVSGRFNTGAVEHNVLVGVDYIELDSDVRYEDTYVYGVDGSAPSIDLYNPDYTQIDPDMNLSGTQLTSDFELSKRQLGVYLQDQIRIGQLVLIGGARWDDFKGTEEGTKYGAPVDNELEQDNWSYRAGALYEFDNGLSPYVNYAESFEPLEGSDRNGNEFDPSTGKQFEVGTKFTSADSRHRIDVALFHILKENVPTRDPNGTAYDKIQAGEVRSRGLEIEGSSQPIDNLLLSLAYTYQDVEVTEDNTGLEGNTPVWVPEQMLSAWADYSFFDGSVAGLTLGAGFRHIGESELNATNTAGKVPDANLVDLALTYDLSHAAPGLSGTEVGLSVNNLFNEEYYSCFDELNCWVGEERTVQAKVSYTF
ncbi:TonB-dependent siderophore receptor [Marinobacter sp. OP 3.4]|uniref:TonB-dependent siderophore receptor n=1 Tax=Marinobacter sp. OP 3.4 TaxID=3076501 RepID=UPI002E24BCFE